MTEDNTAPSAKEKLLSTYRKLGNKNMSTGTTPCEAVQKLITSDPEKQKAYLEGAMEAQMAKEDKSK